MSDGVFLTSYDGRCFVAPRQRAIERFSRFNFLSVGVWSKPVLQSNASVGCKVTLLVMVVVVVVVVFVVLSIGV